MGILGILCEDLMRHSVIQQRRGVQVFSVQDPSWSSRVLGSAALSRGIRA